MQEKMNSVGEVAKILGVSVRTLQYYDKEKLCFPSGYSEGGRRLYSEKDIIKLHRILSMKYLGFSLKQIKNNLAEQESTDDVVQLLKAQEKQLSKQIISLTEAQKAIGSLIEEVTEIDKVDWNKYASIIDLLKANNSNYWIIRHFDENTINSIAKRYDDNTAAAFTSKMEGMWDCFGKLIDRNIPADSDESMRLAKEQWDMVQEFTGGDEEILRDITKLGTNVNNWKNAVWKENFTKVNEYCCKALENYFYKKNSEVNK